MKYYVLRPETAGEVGEKSLVDTSARPPKYERLHYEFVNWLGDELLEAVAAFIVTKEMADRILRSGLSGVELGDVEVTLSPEGEELLEQEDIPEFLWLRIPGRAEVEDFGISEGSDLVVSECALRVLREGGIENCLVEEM